MQSTDVREEDLLELPRGWRLVPLLFAGVIIVAGVFLTFLCYKLVKFLRPQ